jgi:argininosuccinate lyase
MEAGLDYRTAHQVVGRAVRELVETGLAPAALTPERLSAAARATIGRAVAISPETLAGALDPAACAAARRQTGSSAPDEVATMIASCREAIAEGRRLSAAARERAAVADAALLARARELAAA